MNPKSYSKYKYEDLINLGIQVKRTELFGKITDSKPSDYLLETLSFNSQLPMATEKAKCELIISPILNEVVRKNLKKLTYFSGYNFDVDEKNGLKGFCDYLISAIYDSPMIEAPIISIIEAKNDNFELGIPQCIATMYAAQIFNERKGKEQKSVYGAVSIGTEWQFLKLEKMIAYQDTEYYSIRNLPELLGVLQTIVEEY
jgi:hypothetical protein